MKILFIMPSIWNRKSYKFIRFIKNINNLCLEPLSIAVLSALTPKEFERKFYDDRIEDINFDEECDIVAISVETFAAKRAYRIATEFRKRGKKVIMGGFHPSILPDEALKYCDSVAVGEVEHIWKDILDDFVADKLKKKYVFDRRADLSLTRYDRGIYSDKKYLPMKLIETGRGCKFNCEFCSVALHFKKKYIRRPIENIIKDVKSVKSKNIMFIDDNICSDIESAKKLFKELKKLNIKWSGQASADIVNDNELLDLMKKSGCETILIGIESIDKRNLESMNKVQNSNNNTDLLIDKLHDRGIKVIGTFVIGYEYDTKASVKKLVDYAIRKRIFIGNFYPLQPFPGTKTYERLKKEGRLVFDPWWLNPKYKYGDVAYIPKNMSREKLTNLCTYARFRFYSLSSMFYRSFDKSNFTSIFSIFKYFMINIINKILIFNREGKILGKLK